MWDGAELEVLKAVRGPLYARRRDQALAEGPDFAAVLAQTRTQPDRRLEITATFLAGWQRDRDRYEAFEAALGAIPLAKESRKITGVGPAVQAVLVAMKEAHGEALLPYCWEQVVKLAETHPAWKHIAYFGYITELASETSIEPLLWCVDEAPDPEVRDDAHQSLIVHLALLSKDRLNTGKSLHASRAFVYEDLLQRIKLTAKKKP